MWLQNKITVSSSRAIISRGFLSIQVFTILLNCETIKGYIMKKNSKVGMYMAFGIGIGAGMGIVIGAVLSNVAMGIVFGAAFGAAFGLIIGSIVSGKGSNDDNI